MLYLFIFTTQYYIYFVFYIILWYLCLILTSASGVFVVFSLAQANISTLYDLINNKTHCCRKTVLLSTNADYS